ncbi:MAG: hypothetical protein KA765_06710 [Thermoflexales bacterium]|nr:hypothetical protein [Thermoflexales bacterium]
MNNDAQRVDHSLSRGATLAPQVIPPELFALFLHYKRDRVGHESPVAVQNSLIRQFGSERARALITLFEQTAIPARPQEWRRRMH